MKKYFRSHFDFKKHLKKFKEIQKNKKYHSQLILIIETQNDMYV